MGQINKIQNSKRIFAIHGGGNIGLGCMADIVNRSNLEYQIIATSSDKFVNAIINCTNRFYLQHGTDKENDATLIKNITMVYSRDKQNIIQLYADADLLAMCLTEQAFLNVAKVICQGLVERFKKNRLDLQILILMNKHQSERFVQEKITSILNQTYDASYTSKVLEKVKFVSTVTDRIVNKIDKKSILMQCKRKLIELNEYEIAKLSAALDLKKSFHEQIEMILLNPEKLIKAIEILHLRFKLFRAERHFSFYVPQSFKTADSFPDMRRVANISKFADIKNKYINGPHAMLAWMGGLMGCTTIAEAIQNPSMLWYINNLMEHEIGPILKHEYPELKTSDLNLLKTSFIRRCRASVEDTIARVGRDPLRKLNRGDRVRGIIELKQKHKLKIQTPELERGLAAGIFYAVHKIDPSNEECNKISEIFHKKGSYKEVLCYKGPHPNGTYVGLDSHEDKTLISNVLDRISLFEILYKVAKR